MNLTIWIILVAVLLIVAIWQFSASRRTYRKLNTLNEYIQFLLLHLEVYEDHRAKFFAFVSEHSKLNISDQAMASYRAIEDMAIKLEGEILLANVASRGSSGDVQKELQSQGGGTLTSHPGSTTSMEHPLVKQHIEKLLRDSDMFGWIKQVMPELLKLHPIEAQGQVEYFLEIIRWRTDQYFGPNAPHRWTQDDIEIPVIQGVSVSPSELRDIQAIPSDVMKIIGEYSEVLAENPSSSKLPYPKETIKHAIETALNHAQDPKMRQDLQRLLLALEFVPD